MDIKTRHIAAVALGATLLGACTSYFQVTDPTTGRQYYTTDVDDEGDAGAIRFRDERHDEEVTLPSSEVKPISRERYHEGMSTPD
ncbi:hypothetical protein [Denitromonas iodatirespirans]|uniref:Uncharacterized protein n=1 Tax=Denitromonas iodatirespirans TaxID=2795389 RepID=A0A944DEF4_DENI1|nr:hypothetical protein [Denitromonas iodatirespirans]MBT0962822.1 hypothetical protein [Denitromonas iodatirespirans]